ncbi:hypothetical protein M501DRAFT_116591 [Patellaria atrata CBS 101060]|uniref:Uncharacterized protein n=1 Tax=Patellaria atrata CBS 101060 TaxID=1346257 RepID=A0A9P4VU06_9PEZI|nr:hypothetical protein M501DRAFT_116591 [Patellaria atrata CBS 101060]
MLQRYSKTLCIFCKRQTASLARRNVRNVSTTNCIRDDYWQLNREVQHQIGLASPVKILEERLLDGESKRAWNTKLRKSENEKRLYQQDRTASSVIREALINQRSDRFSHEDQLPQHVTVIRRVLRDQLRECVFSKDLIRVIRVSIEQPRVAQELVHIQPTIKQRLKVIRKNETSEAFSTTVNQIIYMMEAKSLVVSSEIWAIGLASASHTDSLPGIKRYLKAHRDNGIIIPSHLFMALITRLDPGMVGDESKELRLRKEKMSKELRLWNNEEFNDFCLWNKEELFQLLLGFPDSSADQAHHLGSFLDRDNWPIYQAWIQLLANWGAGNEVWKEWEWWENSSTRQSKTLSKDPQGNSITAQALGDQWFIEQLFHTGNLERASQVVKSSGIDFSMLSFEVRNGLLDNPEYATLWKHEISEEMKEQYSGKLQKIEETLGIQWVKDGDTGHHVFLSDAFGPTPDFTKLPPGDSS